MSWEKLATNNNNTYTEFWELARNIGGDNDVVDFKGPRNNLSLYF